jgi:hypothetical protein
MIFDDCNENDLVARMMTAGEKSAPSFVYLHRPERPQQRAGHARDFVADPVAKLHAQLKMCSGIAICVFNKTKQVGGGETREVKCSSAHSVSAISKVSPVCKSSKLEGLNSVSLHVMHLFDHISLQVQSWHNACASSKKHNSGLRGRSWITLIGPHALWTIHVPQTV